MEIKLKKDDKKLEIALEGRLDTNTAGDLESKIEELEGVEELVLNFEKLYYISSAGLRVLLSMQKLMNKQGSMKIINATDTVKDVFDVTGFSDILNIE